MKHFLKNKINLMLTKYAVNDKTRAGVFRRGVHHHKNIIKISVRDNDQNIISVEIQRFSKNWNNVCWVNDALCMRPLAGVTCQTSSPSLPHRSLPSFSHRSWRQAMAWAGAVTATGNHKGGGGEWREGRGMQWPETMSWASPIFSS